MKASEIQVFRVPLWVLVFSVIGFIISALGAVVITINSGLGTLSLVLTGLTALFALGLADSLLTRVCLNANALEIVSNFRRQVVSRFEISSVECASGCPVTLVLLSGKNIKLPSVGSASLPSSIRVWLKESSAGQTERHGPILKKGQGND